MTIFNTLLGLHIIAGGISLLLGLYILATNKGSKIHKSLGTIYFIAMLTASLVALPMSYLHSNYFLFIIGIFTSYMLLTGKRYLHIKSVAEVRKTDWILSGIMFLFAIIFICFGVYHLIQNNYFGSVFIVFGSIGLRFVYQDSQNYTGKSGIKNYFLLCHLQRMIGSYIASVTAFLVVNNQILPGIIAWLLPTIMLTPLILFWTRKYTKKEQNE